MASFAGSDQILRITNEDTFGTFNNTNTAVSTYLLLTSGDAFQIAKVPQVFEIMAAGTQPTRRWSSRRSRYSIQGTFKTPIFKDYAQRLLDMALTPTVSGRRLVLPSFTWDWFDGQAARRFSGVKVSQLVLSSSDQDDMLQGTFTLVGKDETDLAPDGSDLPDPDISADFPAGDPFLHKQLSGAIKLNNVVQSEVASVQLTVKNTLYGRFFEHETVPFLNFERRETDAQLALLKKDATNRQAYEDQTARISTILKWDDSTNSITINLQNQVYLTDYSVARDFDTDQVETVGLKSMLDRTSETDLTFTYA